MDDIKQKAINATLGLSQQAARSGGNPLTMAGNYISSTYIYDPLTQRVFPSSPYWGISDANAIQDPKQKQEALNNVYQSGVMAMSTGPQETRLKAPPYGTSTPGKYYVDVFEGEGISGPNASKKIKTHGPYKSSKEANYVRNSLIPINEKQRIGPPYERAFADEMYDELGNLKPQSSQYKFDEVSQTVVPDKTVGTTLKTVNPQNSGVFEKYNPSQRAQAQLGKNITTLDKTMGKNPDEIITIYRGAPKNQISIAPGDFITTNPQLAKDYAGSGHVIQSKVKLSDILDDISEPLGEEYIYRPARKVKK